MSLVGANRDRLLVKTREPSHLANSVEADTEAEAWEIVFRAALGRRVQFDIYSAVAPGEQYRRNIANGFLRRAVQVTTPAEPPGGDA